MKRHIRRGALGAWILGLLTSMTALTLLGSRHPGTPPLHRPHHLADWIAEREVLDVAAAFARLLAICLLAYLIVVTLAQLVFDLVPDRATRGRRIARRLGPRFVAVLTAAVAASAAPVSAAGDAAPSGKADDASTITIVEPGQGAKLRVLPSDPRTSLPWSDPLDDEPFPGRPEPQAVPEDRAAQDLQPHTPRAAEPAPTDASPPDAAETGARPGASEWVVRPGDHLWGIAEETVRARSGGAPDAAPDEHQVARYWVQLVEENRERLVDPTDADLILPGQQLRLP